MPSVAQRVHGTPISVFSEMTLLARQYGAINLGQGFPNFPAPEFIKTAAQTAIANDINQYTTERGRPRLRHALSAKMARLHRQTIDPDREITVTTGATEALFATMQGILNPGDEVILFEPCFDQYIPAVRFAGGIPRVYTLQAPEFAVDLDRLKTLFNDNTKAILINSPHNPTGTLFSAETVRGIADLCLTYDAFAVCDDVYEHLVYDGAIRLPMASVDGMANRTVTISSVAKTFSVTGWKVGWAIASSALIDAINGCHQWTTYCGAAPLQEATGIAIEHAEETNFYAELLRDYQARRDILCEGLSAAGLYPIRPQGSFYVMAQIGRAGWQDDREFCYWLTKNMGVTAIPPSGFYSDPAAGKHLARFAFCKTTDVLHQATAKLTTSSLLHFSPND